MAAPDIKEKNALVRSGGRGGPDLKPDPAPVAGDEVATHAQWAQTGDVISFGPFRLFVGERLLKRGSSVLRLGERMFDILVVLVSRPNQTVSKKDLMAEVWPDVTVG